MSGGTGLGRFLISASEPGSFGRLCYHGNRAPSVTQTLNPESVSTERHSNEFTATLKPEGADVGLSSETLAPLLQQHAHLLPDEQVATSKDVLATGGEEAQS